MVTVSKYQTVPPYCNSEHKNTFLALEFGAKTMPPFLFFILGTVRYFFIKDHGQVMPKYSRFFQAKVGISFTMGVFDVA